MKDEVIEVASSFGSLLGCPKPDLPPLRHPLSLVISSQALPQSESEPATPPTP